MDFIGDNYSSDNRILCIMLFYLYIRKTVEEEESGLRFIHDLKQWSIIQQWLYMNPINVIMKSIVRSIVMGKRHQRPGKETN